MLARVATFNSLPEDVNSDAVALLRKTVKETPGFIAGYHLGAPGGKTLSERRRGREVVDHDAHVLHALDRHALDGSDTTAPATASLGCRSAGGNAPPIGLK